MAANSNIEWTDHTFNPWIGCQAVGPGCAHCYAERWARLHKRDFSVRTRTQTWGDPIKWNRQHDEFFAIHGRRQRVFCASLADWADNKAPDAWRDDLWALIDATPNLDWMLLTKRIRRVSRMAAKLLPWVADPVRYPAPWAHVWLGATTVNQPELKRDGERLLQLPAAKHFLSIEPQLGAINLRRVMCREGIYLDALTGVYHAIHGEAAGVVLPAPIARLDWVICGGESGHNARPMHPFWPRALRDQCEDAGVPFHFKQHGEWAPGTGEFVRGKLRTAAVAFDGRVVSGGFNLQDYPSSATSADRWALVHWAGKKAAGREIDGQVFDGFPTPSGR